MSRIVRCNVCDEVVYKASRDEAPYTCLDCREEASLMAKLRARLAAADELAVAVRNVAGRVGASMADGWIADELRAALAKYEEKKA